MRQAGGRISGADLTTIDAIDVEIVQVVLSEYGPDPGTPACRARTGRKVLPAEIDSFEIGEAKAVGNEHAVSRWSLRIFIEPDLASCAGQLPDREPCAPHATWL